MQTVKIKYFKLGVALLILLTIAAQVYSIINIKALWLDEWFILYNIKFRSFTGLFGNLYYMQQFPRVYLSIVKFIAEVFNYNYFAIRVLPFSIQVINLFLVYFVISKIIFPGSKLKALLFVLFFLSFPTTIDYFSQLKAYTMDMFFTLMSIWWFWYLSNYFNTIKIKSSRYFGMLLFIFIGFFFSYTFPIVFCPLIILFFITCVTEIINKKSPLKAILPIIVFLVALFINSYTDLQFVLSDKGQYSNFFPYVMHYGSSSLITAGLKNIYWLLTCIFFFDKSIYHSAILLFFYFVKIIVFFCVMTGLVAIFYKHLLQLNFKKLKCGELNGFVSKPVPSLYMTLLFFITLLLYFFKMLPVGTHRINYFCFVFIAYFLITGLYVIIGKSNKIKYVLLPLIFFASVFPAIRSNAKEIKNSNLDFDQKIYVNVGNAIDEAKIDKLPIVVSYDEFYPATIMEGQESLMIKAHHEYKPKDSILVFVINQKETLNDLQKLQLSKYIFVTKYHYQIVR